MKSSHPDRPVVLHRRYSNLPIEIPVPDPVSAGSPDSSGRLSGTTPLGRELIRKQIFLLRQKLAEAGVHLKVPDE